MSGDTSASETFPPPMHVKHSMRLLLLCTILSLALLAAADPAARAKRDAAALEKGLVLHEWGIILYQQGFEAGRLDNDSDKPADLPDFIESWDKLAAKQPAQPNLPGAIQIDPFIYLYSKTPQNLTLTVSCPRGLITQWYPAAFRIFPIPGQTDRETALAQGGGMITWRNFDVGPLNNPQLAPTGGNSVWSLLRDTDSSPVTVNGKIEKFLFYRGAVADAPPIVKVEGGANQKYTLVNTTKRETAANLLLIHVGNGKLTTRSLATLAPDQKQRFDIALRADSDQTPAAASAALKESLEEAGLFPKEAASLVRIWQKALFETDGIRLLYLNPPSTTESLLPMSIDAQPAVKVRILLTLVECLRDSKENVVKALVEQLASGAFARRREAQRKLIELGPLAEKELKEALKTAQDEEVRNSIELILQKLKPAETPDPAPPTLELQ